MTRVSPRLRAGQFLGARRTGCPGRRRRPRPVAESTSKEIGDQDAHAAERLSRCVIVAGCGYRARSAQLVLEQSLRPQPLRARRMGASCCGSYLPANARRSSAVRSCSVWSRPVWERSAGPPHFGGRSQDRLNRETAVLELMDTGTSQHLSPKIVRFPTCSIRRLPVNGLRGRDPGGMNAAVVPRRRAGSGGPRRCTGDLGGRR
jgi:hypothetical protein